MDLTLAEMVGNLNEKALLLGRGMLAQKRSDQEIIAAIRKEIALPGFPGNLLAVRLTDLKKVQKAQAPEELERARLLLAMALQEEIHELTPRYKERLANSHK